MAIVRQLAAVALDVPLCSPCSAPSRRWSWAPSPCSSAEPGRHLLAAEALAFKLGLVFAVLGVFEAVELGAVAVLLDGEPRAPSARLRSARRPGRRGGGLASGHAFLAVLFLDVDAGGLVISAARA